MRSISAGTPKYLFELSLEDFRRLPLEELEYLAADIRQAILSACMTNGGHLGASLGTVEIAIALHYVFHSPAEPLIWDVGHQAYAHKLLTGRWAQFSTLRKKGGLSGFLSRKESPHDLFGAGHSSTALSAALAMAWARRKAEAARQWTVAIVGDGGLTAGLSFEALNNFKDAALGPFLLIINDNQMSISKNSGAVASILSNAEQAAGYFNSFGFEYLGPMDGHDLGSLIGTLQGIRAFSSGKPVVLHLMTQKGRGYFPAEERPETYHGVSPMKIEVAGASAQPVKKSYSDVFGDALCKLAEKDPSIVAITAAMTEGTGLGKFSRLYPDRFFDVGIAEPHAVTFAAGLATQGYRPVVAIYSTFLQRSLDEIIHDVALQKLGVIFAIDRAGIVGPDGPTHHGMFDLSFLGMIPGLRVSAPGSQVELENILAEATQSGMPWAIRYPRGSGPEKLPGKTAKGLKWVQESQCARLLIAALGSSAARAMRALPLLSEEERNQVTLAAISDLKPLPGALLDFLSANSDTAVLTIEDGVESGGFGQNLLSACRNRRAPFDLVAYPDHFVEHGLPEELEEAEGLSPAALAKRIRQILTGA